MWVNFLALNKFFGSMYKLCAVRIRHIISTGEDKEYRQVDHHVLVRGGGGGGGTNQKYLPVNEALLLLIYQAKNGQ